MVTEAVDQRTISQLPDIVEGLSGAERTLVGDIIEIRAIVSELGEENLPKADLQQQLLIETYNSWSHQRSVINIARAMRPQPLADLATIQADIASTYKKDPFCLYETETPPNKFGRFYGKYHITSGNLFSSAKQHGNLIALEHSPLVAPTGDEFSDRYEVFDKWREAAYAASKGEDVYSSIIENRLRKAGSSIDHSHSQMALRSGRHEGEMEEYLAISHWYGYQKGENYFDDLFRVHQLLGLGVEAGNLRAFPSLIPVKDAEVIVFADRFDSQERQLLFKIYDYYMNVLGAKAFNFIMGFKPLGYDGRDWGRVPAVIARFINRGDPTAKNGDIAGFELAKTSITSTDQFQVNKILKEALAV